MYTEIHNGPHETEFARGFQDYCGVFEGCHIPELPFCFASSGNAAQYCETITNKQKHKYFCKKFKNVIANQ